MPKKRTWKAHNLKLIKEHKKCAGDVPPTGGMDDLLSEQEFMTMARASGVHPWNSCHYTEEILGLPDTDNMREVKTGGDPQKLVEAVEGLTGSYREVQQSKQLADFKAKMKGYIDRIEFKAGKLNVPSQLLKFKDYTEKFFG